MKTAGAIIPYYRDSATLERAINSTTPIAPICGSPPSPNWLEPWYITPTATSISRWPRLWLGRLPMALLIVVIVSLGAQVARVDWLTKAIGMAVLITAIGLLVAPKLVAYAKGRRIGQPERFKAIQPALTVISGGVLGLCVALTSIGAGALGSVMLLYLYPLRMTPHRLVATDIVYAIPLAELAGLGYLFAGLVEWWMLASLLVGSIPTVLLVSLLAGKIPDRGIQITLALVSIAAGIKVFV